MDEPSGLYDEHYLFEGGRHQRINGIWFRIEDNQIVDRDQYRNDLEERARQRNAIRQRLGQCGR